MGFLAESAWSGNVNDLGTSNLHPNTLQDLCENPLAVLTGELQESCQG